MIRNGKIEISLSGIGKFFGVLLAGTGLLTAVAALAVMPFGAYDTDRNVQAVKGDGNVIIVDVQETPGFALDIFADVQQARYVRTARNSWYAYDTGRPVSHDSELERAYEGFLMRQKADEVLARAAEPQTQAVEVAVEAAPAVVEKTEAQEFLVVPTDETSPLEDENTDN